MIELENPDIIVSATDISICGKAEVLIAKKLGIPVIVSQHGAAIDCPYYQPTLADKFVVWGQETKEMLIRRGYDENKIFIAGSTKYDGIKIKEDIPKGEYILVALQMFSLKEQKEFLEAIVPALKDSGEKVCINLHPGQKKELVEEYLKKYNLEAEIIPGQPSQGISYFIENCKLLITVCSTVAIDAILMNKPVITVNLTGKPDLLPYAKYHSAIGVYKKDDVKKAIEKALHNPKEKKKLLDGKNDFLKNYINFGKGNASKKFVELILGMISKV
jgi:UDP-N-acetylglucosamine 2-epimerase